MASSLSVNFAAGTQHALTSGDPAGLKQERTDTFSWFCWASTLTGSAQHLMGKYEVSTNRGWAVLKETNGLMGVYISNGASNRIIRRSFIPAYPQDGEFTFTGFTYDGSSSASGLILYRNGYALASSVIEDSLSATIDQTVNFQISGINGTAGTSWTGNIDEVYSYARVVSPVDVLTLWNNGVPGDPTVIGPTGDLNEWWPIGEGDTFPTLAANGNSAHNLTMTNMVAGDIEAVFPDLSAVLYDFDPPDFNDVVFGGGAGAQITYKMRGRDSGRTPGNDYIVWTATGDPDFAGTGYAGGSPTPIGALVAGSVVQIAKKTG